MVVHVEAQDVHRRREDLDQAGGDQLRDAVGPAAVHTELLLHLRRHRRRKSERGSHSRQVPHGEQREARHGNACSTTDGTKDLGQRLVLNYGARHVNCCRPEEPRPCVGSLDLGCDRGDGIGRKVGATEETKSEEEVRPRQEQLRLSEHHPQPLSNRIFHGHRAARALDHSAIGDRDERAHHHAGQGCRREVAQKARRHSPLRGEAHEEARERARR